MPIDITCSDCSQSYKVPDNVAGKKIRCPKCKVAVVQVPAAQTVGAGSGGTASSGAAAGGSQAGAQAESQASAEQWQLKTETGDTYGPVDRAELDQWMTEGRVNAQTQLLRVGDSQWQWASTIYPQLNSINSGSQAGSQAGSMALSPVVSTGQPYQHQYANQQQAYTPSRPMGQTGEKSKVVAGLLALLIGSLGIHNFYLGYTGKAVAQLLISLLSCFMLAGISGIWAMIEGIMILTGSIDRDADGYLLRD